jgi:hypothetical protein
VSRSRPFHAVRSMRADARHATKCRNFQEDLSEVCDEQPQSKWSFVALFLALSSSVPLRDLCMRGAPLRSSIIARALHICTTPESITCDTSINLLFLQCAFAPRRLDVWLVQNEVPGVSMCCPRQAVIRPVPVSIPCIQHVFDPGRDPGAHPL